MPRTRQQPEPPIFTFRVRILEGLYSPDDAGLIWREIEIAANQTLADLGEAIPLAFGFEDPHLWSFFLSGQAWDRATEYALTSDPDPFGGPRAHAARQAAIGKVPLPGAIGQQEFLFLFDYGDEWHFGVQLVRQSATVEAGVRYPRVVAQQGTAPPQYPELDEEELDEEEEDDGMDDAER